MTDNEKRVLIEKAWEGYQELLLTNVTHIVAFHGIVDNLIDYVDETVREEERKGFVYG